MTATMTERLGKIDYDEALKVKEIDNHPSADLTSADVKAAYQMVTARAHMMRLCAHLGEYYPSARSVEVAENGGAHEVSGLLPMHSVDAFDADGRVVAVLPPECLHTAPEMRGVVYGLDDEVGASAWDGFYGDGERVSVDTVLAAVDALPDAPKPTQEHVIIVAFDVLAHTREQAHARLMAALGAPDGKVVDSWWVAQDDRQDGSDCYSAVFVAKGDEKRAEAVVAAAGLVSPGTYGLRRCPVDAAGVLDGDGWCSVHQHDCGDFALSLSE